MRTTIKNQKCKNIFIIFIIFSVNFIKKEALACFPVNLAKFLRTPFLQNTSGRLLLIISSQDGSTENARYANGLSNWGTYLGTPKNQIYQDY